MYDGTWQGSTESRPSTGCHDGPLAIHGIEKVDCVVHITSVSANGRCRNCVIQPMTSLLRSRSCPRDLYFIILRHVPMFVLLVRSRRVARWIAGTPALGQTIAPLVQLIALTWSVVVEVDKAFDGDRRRATYLSLLVRVVPSTESALGIWGLLCSARARANARPFLLALDVEGDTGGGGASRAGVPCCRLSQGVQRARDKTPTGKRLVSVPSPPLLSPRRTPFLCPCASKTAARSGRRWHGRGG